ncbi:MAG: hypothetical protein Q8891_04370 [Bacteroidota bacterium]|nr:hypothetical protein [Bacteroidota bacterium]
MHRFLMTFMLHLFVIGTSIAQVNWTNNNLYESKTFVQKQITKIQSLYLDANGNTSHKVFLKLNGLYPKNINFESTPYFSVSYLLSDVIKENGKYIPKGSARPLNLDFHVNTITKQNAANIATPIWDGRVYEDGDSIIVGGYSAKFNERPVGRIDSRGRFLPELNGVDSKYFPILDIPAKQIVFDPFEWKLFRILPTDGKVIQQSKSSFLPLRIYGEQGEPLQKPDFEIKNEDAGSSLVLYLISNGKKIEVANCNLKNSEITDSREGYQPELNEGCVQPANGKVVTLTFQGNYSKNILVQNGELCLNKELKYLSYDSPDKPGSINIDGDFQDWRNIPGVSDSRGDYVSYLFKNPDTDLLEFKITNDDKYLYLYSRVAGAYGRTGKGGRYYWYSFIDVDSNPATGYVPTRDDNCYFGIPIGDDCEAQFEFVGNRFVKTFFGFAGIGAEKEVLSGKLKLGPSYYSEKGKDGIKRKSYKTEYINRGNSRFITHDVTPGTSQDMNIALSPDGSEVEVRVELAGFLKDKSGKSIMYQGKKIDIAIGVEGSSGYYGSNTWGADVTAVKYGYLIK